MQRILAIVGFLAIVFVGYTYMTQKKEKEAQKSEAQKEQPVRVQKGNGGTQQPVEGNGGTQQPVEEEATTPLDWSMEQILADPVTYFEYAIKDAEKKFNEIKAREAQMRIKQKQLARKVVEKQQMADGLNKLLKDAVAAYKTAEEKYASDPKSWVADFPYKGARTKKTKMSQLLVKIKKRAEQAQLVSDKTNGVNVQYENAILVAEKKAFELEMALESLRNNYEIATSTNELDQINFNKEEIEKYVDVSEVYQEMDGGDKALAAISEGSAVQSGYDAEIAELLK